MNAIKHPAPDVDWDQHSREICDEIMAFTGDFDLARLLAAQVSLMRLISLRRTEIMVKKAEYKNRYCMEHGINLDECLDE